MHGSRGLPWGEASSTRGPGRAECCSGPAAPPDLREPREVQHSASSLHARLPPAPQVCTPSARAAGRNVRAAQAPLDPSAASRAASRVAIPARPAGSAKEVRRTGRAPGVPREGIRDTAGPAPPQAGSNGDLTKLPSSVALQPPTHVVQAAGHFWCQEELTCYLVAPCCRLGWVDPRCNGGVSQESTAAQLPGPAVLGGLLTWISCEFCPEGAAVRPLGAELWWLSAGEEDPAKAPLPLGCGQPRLGFQLSPQKGSECQDGGEQLAVVPRPGPLRSARPGPAGGRVLSPHPQRPRGRTRASPNTNAGNVERKRRPGQGREAPIH